MVGNVRERDLCFEELSLGGRTDFKRSRMEGRGLDSCGSGQGQEAGYCEFQKAPYTLLARFKSQHCPRVRTGPAKEHTTVTGKTLRAFRGSAKCRDSLDQPRYCQLLTRTLLYGFMSDSIALSVTPVVRSFSPLCDKGLCLQAPIVICVLVQRGERDWFFPHNVPSTVHTA